jgi:hypothetical protein
MTYEDGNGGTILARLNTRPGFAQSIALTPAEVRSGQMEQCGVEGELI